MPVRRTGGFTLIELIVTLAIAALLVTLVPSALGKGLESLRYRATVREVLTDLRAARTQAQLTGRAVPYRVHLPERSLGVEKRMRELPDDLTVDAQLASATITAPGHGAIVFYPDGSATGGSILIARSRTGQGVRLRVDWLLGRVTQEAFHAAG
ncbi:MAG: GspH/FimT family pseudopilin [Rhodocyclaceae bacterium]|nr:GspH/FimT family pseudopilin [Rhodocyclaceae bacterium]